MVEPVLLGVLVGNVLLAVGSALVGTFTLLRREAMVADVLAHAVLPGIGLAYAVTHRKELPVLLTGALLAAGMAAVVLGWLRREVRLQEDLRLGLVLSVAFGLGIVVLTALQQQPEPQQAGLWRFLFGQAAAVTWSDTVMIALVVAFVGGFVGLAFKELVALAFDAEFVRTLPLSLRGIELGYRMAVVALIVVGIQSVGALLIVAFFVLPPMAARLWVRRVGGMLLGGSVVAVVAVLVGIGLSLAVPGVATGPAIVTVAAAVATVSHLFAPRRGVVPGVGKKLWGWLRRWDEHGHKLLYHIAEQCGQEQWEGWDVWREVSRRRGRIRAGLLLGWLWMRGSVRWQPLWRWSVTARGCRRALQITRRHRLWELYLERVLGVPAERVHAEAELVEHVLSAELEERLEQELRYPEQDPHGRRIPREPGQ